MMWRRMITSPRQEFKRACRVNVTQADGVQVLVTELVEGPTLVVRIAQGLIPIEDALPVAKQVVEALEAAHD